MDRIMKKVLTKLITAEGEDSVFQADILRMVEKKITIGYKGVVYINAKSKEDARNILQRYFEDEESDLVFYDESCKENISLLDVDWEKDPEFRGHDDEDEKVEYCSEYISPVK